MQSRHPAREHPFLQVGHSPGGNLEDIVAEHLAVGSEPLLEITGNCAISDLKNAPPCTVEKN